MMGVRSDGTGVGAVMPRIHVRLATSRYGVCKRGRAGGKMAGTSPWAQWLNLIGTVRGPAERTCYCLLPFDK